MPNAHWIRLRDKAGPPILGWNMHVVTGHQRLTVIKQYHRPGDILDAGSGEGGFSIAMSTWPNCKVWSIDIQDAPNLIRHPKIHFERMDVYNIPKTYPMFDTIVFMELIEHLEEPRVALEILHDHLKPKGVMVISTPHVDHYDYEIDHIWRFDQDSVEELLKGMFAITFTDDIFIYGIIRKIDERTFTYKT